MKPVNTGGHAVYQEQLISRLKQYYPDAFARFGPNLWDLIDKFYSLDLSKADELMSDRYSVFGPKPRLPSDMIRSMMAALILKVTSYTAWSAELKMNPLAAIVSGFDPNDTPGVGTFYDFTDRLWLSEKNNLSSYAKPPKMKKVQKPDHPDDKADPVEDINVEQLIAQLKASPPTADQPFARLFQLFKEIFLDHSVELGLINLSQLVLSGDGTEVETSARHRYRRLCLCNCLEEKGIWDCSCNRFYSQPDTDCGYDSSRHKMYYGYNLYMMTAADSDNDLPIFPLLNPASLHDSFGVCKAYAVMKAFLKEIHVKKVLLDSAHDAMAIYQFCQENSIAPIIDLNERGGVSFQYKGNYTVGRDGIPYVKPV